MTLSEAHQGSFEPRRAQAIHGLTARYSVEQALQQLYCGGLPVPLFTRDEARIKSYFQSWMETALLRDVQRVYGKGYDGDVAYSILQQLSTALRNGEYAGLKHFRQNARKLRPYLKAFEDIFLLQKLQPHSDSSGTDLWTFTDTGIAAYWAGGVVGDGLELSLGRIFVLKEIRAICEYSGQRIHLSYFKTARGAPVDLVWGDTALKVSHLPKSQLDYDLRPLRSAVRKLKIKKALILCPRDEIAKEKGGKLMTVPWTYYS